MTRRREVKAVIFDLGNTLVSYGTREQWPPVLARCIACVTAYLHSRDMLRIPPESISARVVRERSEPANHRVRPLEQRLMRIFELKKGELRSDQVLDMCRCFLKPIFAVGTIYDDSTKVLRMLRRSGYRTGILSNTPWGSPGVLWREEIARHGLLQLVDEAAFCTDAGWRKPAKPPFEYITGMLHLLPGECVFVGDDVVWDIRGARAVKMPAVHIDRSGGGKATGLPAGTPTVFCLQELFVLLKDNLLLQPEAL